MPTGLSSTFMAGLATTLVILVLAVGTGIFLTRGRRLPLTLARKQSRERKLAAPPPKFIGRETELKRFRQLLAVSKQSSPVLVVGGGPGIGKRALLEQFREVCRIDRAKKPARCGPVIDMRQAYEVDKLLATIADELVEQRSGTFRRFESALNRYREVTAGRMSRPDQALKISREVVATAGAIIPLGGAQEAAKVLDSPVADRAAALIAGPGDLDAVMGVFVEDLIDAAAQSQDQRLVLLFSDLDSRPEDREVIWLREWLVPMLTNSPILIVVSAEDEAAARLPLKLGRPEVIMLEPFTPEESQRYVREIIGVQNQLLVTQVAADSAGILERLEGYRLYFQKHPALRDRDSLEVEAYAWAAGGSVYELLQQVRSPFLQKVLLASSPLRWFNAPLLEAVAAAGELASTGDDVAGAAALLERGRRPSWVTNVGGGWGIEGESRRRAFVDEFRRLNPAQFRAVHSAAADYHRRILEAWGRGLSSRRSSEPADVSQAPRPPAGTRPFDDSTYVGTLSEWLYHLMAVDPDRAFALLAEYVVEAIFKDCDDAASLLDIGPEIKLERRQRLYLDLLQRATKTYEASQYAEAARAFGELFQAGFPTPVVKPAVEGLLGIVQSRLGLEEATEWFERADKDFRETSTGIEPDVLHMHCVTMQWLAFGIAVRDQTTDRALKLLEEAAKLAAELQDTELLGDLNRTRAMVFEQVTELDNAEAYNDKALRSYEGAGLPSSVALARRDRARLLLNREKYAEAEAELTAAAAIYSYLADPEQQAQVAVEKLDLFLRRGDGELAEEQKVRALNLRRDDPALYNSIGSAYYESGVWAAASDAYREATRVSPDTAVYHVNLANALAPQEGKENEAEREYQEALKRTPDPGVQLSAAMFWRRQNDHRGTDRFAELRSQRQAAITSDPSSPRAHAALGDLLIVWSSALTGQDANEAFRAAAKCYRRALRLAPDEIAYRWQRGRCLVELGELSEGLRELWLAADKAPGRYNIRKDVEAAIEKLDTASAIPELEHAASLYPDAVEFRKALARKVGELQPAEQLPILERAVAKFDRDPEFQFLLGMALVRGGRRPEPLATGFEAEPSSQVSSATVGQQSEGASAAGLSDPATSPSEEPEIAHLRRAVDLRLPGTSPQRQARYLCGLAEALIERRRWVEAAGPARNALELQPDDGQARALYTRTQRGIGWDRVIDDPMPVVRPIIIEVAADLLEWVKTPDHHELYETMFPAMQEMLRSRLGLTVPGTRVRPAYDLPRSLVRVALFEIPRYVFHVPAPYVASAPPETCARLAGVTGNATIRPWDGGPGTIVGAPDLDRLNDAGIPTLDPRGIILSTLAVILGRHAALFGNDHGPGDPEDDVTDPAAEAPLRDGVSHEAARL